jgi:hypothetical protein
MLKHIVRLVAAIGLTIGSLALSAEPAEATRPIVGYPYKDVCKNIPGKQPIYMLYGTGPYRFVNKDKGICTSRRTMLHK